MMVNAGVLFDEAAQDYDRARRQLVPGFDGFYGAVLETLPFGMEEEIRVLDLGAGTGLLSAMVAERFPRSRVTLVDISIEMLRVARRRLSSEKGRFGFCVMDYARKPLPQGYDVVVSALSIHHLTDGDKREVFQKSHEALLPGGYFINADQVAGETPGEDARYKEWWLERVRAAGVGERDLVAALRRMRADKNSTLKAQLGWLEETGFERVAYNYDDNRFAVYNGRKPTTISDVKGKDQAHE